MTDGRASLVQRAFEIVTADAPADKTECAFDTAKAWRAGRLSLSHGGLDPAMPDRPGRPAVPELLAPRHMPKRWAGGKSGLIALLHAIAHIELNAVDLTWDLIGRFGRDDMPRAFFDNWVKVGMEEAKHFSLLAQRLEELGSGYGALPAHDGLWQAASNTAHDLLARLAIVPLVLEARGLDVTPGMIDKTEAMGDQKTSDILQIIYADELGHVRFGMHWFRFLCERRALDPQSTFQDLVRRCFKGRLKPPFNEAARAQAGLSVEFYRPLA
jgi:uncharacterized ferritin-like protein (DUF455 family)